MVTMEVHIPSHIHCLNPQGFVQTNTFFAEGPQRDPRQPVLLGPHEVWEVQNWIVRQVIEVTTGVREAVQGAGREVRGCVKDDFCMSRNQKSFRDHGDRVIVVTVGETQQVITCSPWNQGTVGVGDAF